MAGKQLTLSTSDKVFAGVCGGLAQYFGMDATAVRIGYVAVTVLAAGFPGLLIYIILALVLPKR